MNQNTRTRVSIDLLAIDIYRQHRKLILGIFTAAYIHLIFLFEESNIISRIWCPLDVSISFNELQCHYWFLYVMTAILDSNQCCRFCGPTPNHSDNGSYIYILRKLQDSNLRNFLQFVSFQDWCIKPTLPNFHTRDLLFQLLFPSSIDLQLQLTWFNNNNLLPNKFRTYLFK